MNYPEASVTDLKHVSINDLSHLLIPDLPEPAWPGLRDLAVKARAQEHARQSGLWERIGQQLTGRPAIPVLLYSDYCDYRRTGARERFERAIRQRRDQTHLAALALWLEHPAAQLDYLQDLLWAWCESTWHIPAADQCHIELVSSEIGRMLAEYGCLFADRLDEVVRRRVAEEIDRRLLNIALDWRRNDWWNTGANNWNTVCNGNLIQIALYQIQDPGHLATLVHSLVRRMDYALAAFREDGGCEEGFGYWQYGFGHFLDAALVLHHRTGGRVNLADTEHCRRICRFPLALHLRGTQYATFSDSGSGYVTAQVAIKSQRLCGVEDLFSLTESLPGGLLRMDDIRSLGLYQGQRPAAPREECDVLLPDLGYAKAYAGRGVVLAAVGGNNGASHNHNDLGSFQLMVGNTMMLADPGLPLYNAKTFSPRRYEMLFCRSRGHSVPVINGLEQPAGAQYSATIEATGLNGDGLKTVTLDLSRAYADASLEMLLRQFTLQDGGEVLLRDTYRFARPPVSLEEAFVTFEVVTIQPDGCSVQIGQGAERLIVRAEQPGTFGVETISAKDHEGQDRRDLRRIRFVPAELSSQMELAFRLMPQS